MAHYEFWHTSSSSTRPEHVRLQQHARATRIKLEPTREEHEIGAKHLMQVLREAALTAQADP